MNKDKQIEERRDISDIIFWSGYGFDRGTCNDISKQIQEQGYRKASEIAREIFEEIEKQKNSQGAVWLFTSNYAELKRKYTEGEG